MQPRDPSYLPGVYTNHFPGERALGAPLTNLEIPAAPSVALDQLMSRLWRRKLWVGGAAILGALAGLLICKLQTPTFRAITSVQLEGFNQDYFLRDVLPIAPLLANASAQNYLENQVKVIQSRTLAGRVAEK